MKTLVLDYTQQHSPSVSMAVENGGRAPLVAFVHLQSTPSGLISRRSVSGVLVGTIRSNYGTLSSLHRKTPQESNCFGVARISSLHFPELVFYRTWDDIVTPGSTVFCGSQLGVAARRLLDFYGIEHKEVL